jgi:hypothetical protein
MLRRMCNVEGYMSPCRNICAFRLNRVRDHLKIKITELDERIQF